MRVSLLGAVLVLAMAAGGCGGDSAEPGRQSTEDWAAGFCEVFAGYFSATEQQVAGLDLAGGPLRQRLADGLSLAEGQVRLLTDAADAVDALVPGGGSIDEFQAEVSESLRADAERMQVFVDDPPETMEEIQALLAVGSVLAEHAIEVIRTSEKLDDAGYFALVDDPVCARWS